MPKLKKRLIGNFTIINNTVLRDKRMGCTERGAYVTLVSMADNWNFSIRGLAAIMPDSVTKISGALKKLEALGYLRRERIYENGKIKDWVYYIYDEPCNEDTSNNDVENSVFFDSQDTDLSDTENLDTENQHQESEHLEKPYDYIITKEEISKKKYQAIQYQSINPVPHMNALLKSVLILSIILDTFFSSFFKSSHQLPLLIVSSAQNQRRKSAVG